MTMWLLFMIVLYFETFSKDTTFSSKFSNCLEIELGFLFNFFYVFSSCDNAKCPTKGKINKIFKINDQHIRHNKLSLFKIWSPSFVRYLHSKHMKLGHKPASIFCSKLTIETLEEHVKYVHIFNIEHSWQRRQLLLLTLNMKVVW